MHTIQAVLLGALIGGGCYTNDARITGSGEYETGGGGTQSAARGKSKMKGWGSECGETEECDKWALDCARNICTFTCKTDQDCAKVDARCVARYEHSNFESERVCVPRK